MSDVWANDKEANAVVAGDGTGGFGTGSDHNVFAVSFKGREQSRAGRGAYRAEHSRSAMAALINLASCAGRPAFRDGKSGRAKWAGTGLRGVIGNREPAAVGGRSLPGHETPAKAASAEGLTIDAAHTMVHTDAGRTGGSVFATAMRSAARQLSDSPG